MLLLLGSMNMAWAAISSYPALNGSDNKNKVSWNSTDGCFELQLLVYDDDASDGHISGLHVYFSVDNGSNYTEFAYLHNSLESSDSWYTARCSSPCNRQYGNIYAYGTLSDKVSLGEETLLSNTEAEPRIKSYKKNNRDTYITIKWYPTKSVRNTTLDKGINVKFKTDCKWTIRSSSTSFNSEATVTINNNYSSSFSSNDWQIDGSWGYNLSLNASLPSTVKYWNIAKVTPTGQSSRWVDFSASGISSPNVSNGTFNLAEHITNDGTIQMYTRVYPHYNDKYSPPSDPFFYDVASSATITVKNRTLTWNDVADGAINFYYNDQRVTLTKGQNVPKGTYAVKIDSECPPKAKFDNAELVANANKFPFSVNNDGQHTLLLTGKKHVYENCKCTGCDDVYAALGALCGYNEGTITNNYVAANVANPIANQVLDGANSVNNEQLASGEIAYKLNVGQDATVWYQTLGEDVCPVLNSDSKVVYAVKHKDVLYINEGITVPEYTLYDGYEFSTPVAFNAENASYSRTMRSTWGTIVLPFAVDNTVDNGEIQFYYLSGLKEDAMVFSQFEDDVIPAGTPMVVKKLTEGEELVIEATDTEISGATSPQVYNNQFVQMSLFGTFVNQNYDVKNQDIGRNFYYISNNQFWHATGTIALKSFRAMFELSNTMNNPSFYASSSRFSISEEEESASGIESLDSDLFEEGTLYDLNGRKTDDIKPGEVYMLNGQKVIFK